MRTTLSIPDEYYSKLKPTLKTEGYSTVNELLLDLLRHHFDDRQVPGPQFDGYVSITDMKEEVEKDEEENRKDLEKNLIKTPKEAIKKVKEKKPDVNICPHGFMKGLCKNFDCNQKYA